MSTFKIFKDYNHNKLKYSEFNKTKIPYRQLIRNEIDNGFSPIIITNSIMISLINNIVSENKDVYLQEILFNEHIEEIDSKEINSLVLKVRINQDNHLKKLLFYELDSLNSNGLIDILKINLLYKNSRIEVTNGGVITSEENDISDFFKKYILSILESQLL